MAGHEAVMRAVVHQLLLGLRESLTIADQIGQPIEVVNAALERLQDECEGCITMARPYANEPRVAVTVVRWEALKRTAG
jgi:hypothetical protein